MDRKIKRSEIKPFMSFGKMPIANGFLKQENFEKEFFFEMKVGFDENLNADDIAFDNTIIDKASLDIISGSVVDFKKEMIGESFVITNPKATASCGCGLSFSI